MDVAIDLTTTLLDAETAKQIGDTLEAAYPGWGWLVHVKGDYCTIINASMEAAIKKQTKRNAAYGMTLFLSKYASASELKAKILQMGGELLERSHVQAAAFRGDTIRQVDMR